jgi:hypothetical protein
MHEPRASSGILQSFPIKSFKRAVLICHPCLRRVMIVTQHNRLDPCTNTQSAICMRSSCDFVVCWTKQNAKSQWDLQIIPLCFVLHATSVHMEGTFTILRTCLVLTYCFCPNRYPVRLGARRNACAKRTSPLRDLTPTASPTMPPKSSPDIFPTNDSGSWQSQVVKLTQELPPPKT